MLDDAGDPVAPVAEDPRDPAPRVRVGEECDGHEEELLAQHAARRLEEQEHPGRAQPQLPPVDDAVAEDQPLEVVEEVPDCGDARGGQEPIGGGRLLPVGPSPRRIEQERQHHDEGQVQRSLLERLEWPGAGGIEVEEGKPDGDRRGDRS